MFNNLIRQRRQQMGLSQTKLACMLEVAESTLSDLELGKRQPWPKIKGKLSKALQTSEKELWPEISASEEVTK
jgi:transcriptional regulator with XRE-family HTH domain